METCLFRMQDGRSFTDYRPRCTINSSTSSQTSSYDQRMGMIHNAEAMMRNNMESAKRAGACNGRCIQPSVTPGEANMVQCGKSFCTYHKSVDGAGVGTGRNYNVD